MKKIGILFGRERAFPGAVLAQVSQTKPEGVEIEPVVLGGESLDEGRPYDVILDRISHDVEFYRTLMRKFAQDGIEVVPNPLTTPTDDRFFSGVVMRRQGMTVPKRVVLPTHDHPSETSPESLSNLMFPLNWEEIFDHVQLPALLRPAVGHDSRDFVRVENLEQFFTAFATTGRTVMLLEEEIVGEASFRCFVIGQNEVRVTPWNVVDRNVPTDVELPTGALLETLEKSARKLARAFNHDVIAFDVVVRDGEPVFVGSPILAPIADPELIGEENFTWMVEKTSAWLLTEIEPPKAKKVKIETRKNETKVDVKVDTVAPTAETRTDAPAKPKKKAVRKTASKKTAAKSTAKKASKKSTGAKKTTRKKKSDS